MQNYITSIARKPYLTPDPGDSRPYYPSYQYSESTNSIFCNDSQINVEDLENKFRKLEINLPLIVRLQDTKLSPGPPQNIHDGKFHLFLAKLPDTNVHPYSLCPFPMDQMDISYVMQTIFDSCVPPDRSAWALQYIVKKSLDPTLNLTDILLQTMDNMSDPSYKPDFLAKVCFYCYEKNILEHHKFLMGAIKKIPPRSLNIFKREIIRTHTVLSEGLRQKDKVNEIMNMLSENFILQKTHIIQFAILFNYFQQQAMNPYSFYVNMSSLMNSDLLNKRAKSIFQIITPTHLSVSTLLRDAIISAYPYYDSVKFRANIERAILFMQKDEYQQEEIEKIVIDVIEVLLWFNEDDRLPCLASAISLVISALPLEEENFPLTELINFIYEHISEITRFRHLFVELQKDEQITYIGFMERIKQLGLFMTKPKETLTVVSNLPFFKRKAINSTLFHRTMKRFHAEGYDALVAEVSEADPQIETAFLKKIDVAKNIPYTALYGMGSFMVDKCVSFSDALEVIFLLDLDTLVPDLIDRLTGRDPLHFSIKRRFIPRMMHILSILVTHNKMNILTDIISKDISDQTNILLGIFIREHYENDKGMLGQITELTKANKGNAIFPEKIMELFRRFSYLCSLHTFDAFHCVENIHNFEMLFKAFMKDLLSFYSLKAKTLFNFFVEFTQSGCISRPMNFFVKIMISVLLTFTEEEFDERLSSLLEEFFEKVFENNMFLPSAYLAESSKKRGRGPLAFNPGTKLVQLLLNIAKRRPSLFTPNNCFNDNSIKMFIQEPKLLTELIEELKKGPLPQLTDELLNSFDKSCAVPPITLSSAYFALLPEEARDKDFNKAFNYFVKQATPENCRFYAYWLKYYIYFNQATPQSSTVNFPVLFTQVDKQKVAAHNELLAKSFFNLFLSFSDTVEDHKKAEVFLDAWSLVCQTDKVRYQTPSFANAAIKLTAQHISASNSVTSPYIVEFLRPAIVIPLVTMDQLVDICFKLPEKEENFIFAATVFVSYITHCAQEPKRDKIEMAAQCLLKWLPKIPLMRCRGYDFILDSFNFIICFSSTILNPRDQSNMHNALGPYYVMVPENARDPILLNLPPQMFVETKEPLYINVQADEPPKIDTYQQMPIEPPRQAPTDFTPSFDTGYNDDFTWFD